MNEIDFININQSLDLEQEFGSEYIKSTDCSFGENASNYCIESEILDKNHHSVEGLAIDSCIFPNFEPDFGKGYIKLADFSFNEDTGHCLVKSEILDENHNRIGDLTINGYIDNFHKDDHEASLKVSIKVDLKGDIEKIHSLFEDAKTSISSFAVEKIHSLIKKI